MERIELTLLQMNSLVVEGIDEVTVWLIHYLLTFCIIFLQIKSLQTPGDCFMILLFFVGTSWCSFLWDLCCPYVWCYRRAFLEWYSSRIGKKRVVYFFSTQVASLTHSSSPTRGRFLSTLWSFPDVTLPHLKNATCGIFVGKTVMKFSQSAMCQHRLCEKWHQ